LSPNGNARADTPADPGLGQERLMDEQVSRSEILPIE
jgi:hypothetical protein